MNKLILILLFPVLLFSQTLPKKGTMDRITVNESVKTDTIWARTGAFIEGSPVRYAQTSYNAVSASVSDSLKNFDTSKVVRTDRASQTIDGSLEVAGNMKLNFTGGVEAYLEIIMDDAGNQAIITKALGDENYRFEMQGDGAFGWGAGSTGFDVFLLRNGIGSLGIQGGLSVGDVTTLPPTNGMIIKGNVVIGTTTDDSMLTIEKGANIKRGLKVGGSVTAPSFIGSGSGLTGVLKPADSTTQRNFSNSLYLKNADSTTLKNTFNASNINSGTLSDARLSSNIPLLNAANTFTGATNTFNGIIDIGSGTQINPNIYPKVFINANADNIQSLQLRNINAGTNAEMRFITAADDSSYIAFTQPSKGNTSTTFLGVPKEDGSFIFNSNNGTASGGTRGLYLFTFNNRGLGLGTNNLIRQYIDSSGNVRFFGEVTLPNISGTTAIFSTTDGATSNPLTLSNRATGNNTGIRLNYNLSTNLALYQAYIDAVRTNTGAAQATYLAFGTHNGTSLAERVRISEAGNVGIGTATPAGQLDVVSTTGALIVPRMSTTQRDAMTAVNGSIIYNTTTNKFNFRENNVWTTKTNDP